MTIYCDTSLLVAALTSEIHSVAARSWLNRQAAGKLVASRWVSTEVASALAQKQRRDILDAGQRRLVSVAWDKLAASSLTILPVDQRHFDLAASLVDSGPSGLRAGDALHLAIAIDHGAGLATLDDDLATAAKSHGVDVAEIA